MSTRTLPTRDRLLSLKRAARILSIHESDLRGALGPNGEATYLKAGVRYRGTSRYLLESYVIKHMHFGMPAQAPEQKRGVPFQSQDADAVRA